MVGPNELRRYHLLFFAPVAGWLVTWNAKRRVRDDVAAEAELAGAVRWQFLGALVVIGHVGLQLAIEAVRVLYLSGPPLPSQFDVFVVPMLFLLTALNVVGAVVEGGFLGAWAVAAWRGRPYPVRLVS